MKTDKHRHFSETGPEFFKRLRSISEGTGSEVQAARALRIFESFLWGSQVLALDGKQGEYAAKSVWPKMMDERIAIDLDHKSIHHFVGLVLQFYDGASQAERSTARHAKDPKQIDKLAVFDCWQLWQADPSRYDGKASFSRDMLDKFASLKSQPTIERWCRKWENDTKPAK